MGLLDRAKGGELFSPLTSQVINKALNTKTGILEMVPLFFSTLLSHWGIEKAILLTHNFDSQSYGVAQVSGMDVTTRRRLIVEESVLGSWGIESSPIAIKDEKLFRPYFSLRESTQIERLIVIPLKTEQLPFALLLIPIDDEESRILTGESVPFAFEADFLARLFKSLNPSPLLNNSLKAQTTEEIKKGIVTEDDDRIILKLSLPFIVKTIETIDKNKDTHEIQVELLSLFSSFFNERVILYLDERKNLFISQPEDLFPGEELVTHQIFLSLQQLFGNTFTRDAIVISLLKNANDSHALESFLVE